jgi:hypothetical protein
MFCVKVRNFHSGGSSLLAAKPGHKAVQRQHKVEIGQGAQEAARVKARQRKPLGTILLAQRPKSGCRSNSRDSAKNRSTPTQPISLIQPKVPRR